MLKVWKIGVREICVCCGVVLIGGIMKPSAADSTNQGNVCVFFPLGVFHTHWLTVSHAVVILAMI